MTYLIQLTVFIYVNLIHKQTIVYSVCHVGAEQKTVVILYEVRKQVQQFTVKPMIIDQIHVALPHLCVIEIDMSIPRRVQAMPVYY